MRHKTAIIATVKSQGRMKSVRKIAFTKGDSNRVLRRVANARPRTKCAKTLKMVKTREFLAAM